MGDSLDRAAAARAAGRHSTRLAPLWVFGVALAVYASGLVAHTGSFWPQSRWPHFLYYAQALLDGQLHFSVAPPVLHDLAQFEGRLYLHFPPFPALLLTPWVVLLGLDASDRVVSVLLGATNGALLWWLLDGLDRRRLVPSTPQTRALLCAFFLFGTVHWTLAVTSNPWEFAHVLCNTGVLLALGLGFRRRYSWAALAWVAVLFTRSHVFTAAPIVALLHLWVDRREAGAETVDWRPWLAPAAIGALGVLGLLGFNYARFGHAFENGASYHAMHEAFRANFEAYGYFSPHYLGRNLRALLWLTPVSRDTFPFFTFTPEGLSVFLASPLYLLGFASVRSAAPRPLLWGLALALLPPLVPILLLIGTGELQFGHRYTSDIQVFGVLLVALGLGTRVTALAWTGLALSVTMNAYGAAWFVSTYAN